MKQRIIHILISIGRYVSQIDRTRIVLLVFAGYGTFILFTAFRYTVVDYDYYKGLAEKQQTAVIKNPVSRGAIYSKNEPVGVFATSTDLPDLAIDPQAPGSKEKLENFLTDITTRELCGNRFDEKCIENAYKYAKEDLPSRDYEPSETEILAKIREEVRKRIHKTHVDFVMVKANLTPDEIRQIEEMKHPSLTLSLGNLYVNPTTITDRPFLAAKLEQITGTNRQELDYKLSLRTVRYVKMLRKMGLTIKDEIDKRLKNEKEFRSKWMLTEADGVSGFLIVEPHPSRFYPEKHLASQIIGFVDNENDGRYGIEGYFNDELRWSDGVRIGKKDISGRTIGMYDLGKDSMVDGSDITLTIDRNIQKEVSKLLEEGVKEFRANRGTVVIMDPKTGAIISMASYPDFDPNNFQSVYELERVSYSKYPNPLFDLLWVPVFVEDTSKGVDMDYQGKKIKLRIATDSEIGNPAVAKYKYKNSYWPGTYVNDSIGSLYEPWSVFKAVTTAIGVDTGDIRPHDKYMDRGYVEIDNFRIKNVSKECIGYHTYAHALNWSCNVGMIDIVQKIGRSLFSKYVQEFGYGQKSNITLEGEVFGKIEPYEKWSRAKLFTQSFGQGITATVLQMAAAYSVLANGGVYMEPYIVDSMKLADGTVIKNAPRPLRRVIKEETSKTIIAMLTDGATVGFAKKGSVDGYDVAGKTGTSQIASKWRYEQGGPGHTITSYGGFAPSSNPKFVMIVKIERPRSAEYAETTSSALFSRISKYLLNYYGIPKSK